MSLATWKKEFYPTPASRVSKKNALAHSLKKWLELYKAVLKRHGLEREGEGLFDKGGNAFEINGDSCALCEHFATEAYIFSESCPLAVALGCPCTIGALGKPSPYQAFVLDSNPRPMISALRKAIKEQK